MAMDMHAMGKVLLDCNSGNGVFYVVCVEMLEAGQFKLIGRRPPVVK
jgi:hypothetical protein